MGTLTGSTYDTDVRAILGAINTDLLPTATLLRNTNAGYIEDVCSKWNVLELRTSATANTTASTQAYTPAVSNCLKFIALTNAAGQVLKEITPDTETPFASPSAALTSSTSYTTGVPMAYIRKGGASYVTLSFALLPVPDGAYPLTVWYRSRPAEIAAGTATAIDALWDQAILYYSASRSAAFLRMYDDAMTLRKYADMLALNVARSFDLVESHDDEAVKPAAGG